MIGRSRGNVLVAVGLAVVTWSCGGPTAPDSGDQVEIVLSVTGGLTGQDWQYTVDGQTGRIVGDRCVGTVGCDWEGGQELATFHPEILTPLASEFFARGFFEGPADHGTACCDQFEYVLTYRDADHHRTIHGSGGTMPGDLLELIGLVEQFVADRRAERLEASR